METDAFDVLVVGAGPAGLAAGLAAAERDASVLLLDDNPDPGGQIWRADRHGPAGPAAELRERARAAGADFLNGATVVDAGPDKSVVVAADGATRSIRWRTLVLATGARELFLPFPGWTLPGVMGAGGLQALVKGGWPVAGAEVVVAGSGPLLLAVGAYLKRAGARVALLAEQASFLAAASLGPKLAAHPRKARQALSLAWNLMGVRRSWSTWPIRAEGDERLEAVVVDRNGENERIECDLLACGFGLVPNLEIACHLGCRLGNGGVEVDTWQHTSVPDVFAVGEVCGIGGVDVALVEGEIAGRTAASDSQGASELFDQRARERSFGDALERAFRLREELGQLAEDDTIFCRCEDVPTGAVRPFADPRDAKLKTRCGMGPCQGRVCGAAGRHLFGWRHDRVRPPFFPVPVGTLASAGAGRTDSSNVS